ncbi:phosphotransferase [Nocardia bovistercoris]|uniref:Phosphotransferase n=1 Tax=Nocardia bovistercoris TaxID=2785916 RepID=A0A931IFD2_9NOCA|nr:phosphotransferase [Nocardia bovistercoris]MBH0779533.1 phosphotransferase [Nocardia bovistercoris]
MQDALDDAVVESPADLTREWLTQVVGAGEVAEFRYERVGTGQVSDCFRVHLDYARDGAGPRSVILKVASSDPTSRQTGLMMGLYESEVRFYRELVPHLTGGPLAACHHAAIDTETGAFDLLIDDALPAVPGDEIVGATAGQADLAVRELGRLHALVRANPALLDAAWMDRGSMLDQAVFAQLYAMFLDRYTTEVDPRHLAVCEALVASFDDYLAMVNADAKGLVDGDYRLDNMLFGDTHARRSLTVVDWQSVMAGPATTDLSYFLGGALTAETRRAHYDDLLRAYHRASDSGTAVTQADIRESVRKQSFMGVTMSIAASVVVERTPRGDELFMATLSRHCEHVLDTDAVALL